MKWELISPALGDIIRVRSGNIWHYGIYVSDDEVIQFGANPTRAEMLMGSDVTVMSGSIEDFLLGGFLEVAAYDKKELKSKSAPEDVVKTARARIGEGGYHIIHNNCEHFVNECVFGKHACSQVDSVRDMFKNMPLLEVYIAKIPDNIKMSKLHPKARYAEINACKNPRVKLEKYCSWKLLESAVGRTFGLKFSNISFNKNSHGKWECENFYFSLSHSNGLVAVALSKKPVGVDIEVLDSINPSIAKRILSDNEFLEYNLLEESKRQMFLLEAWTKKESEFKRSDAEFFSPQNVLTDNSKSIHIDHGGKIYMLSVAGENLDKLRIRGIEENKL